MSSNDLPPPEAIRAALVEAASSALDPLNAHTERLDPQLRRALVRTRATVERAADRFTARYARSLRERDHLTTARLDRLLGVLQPGGVPQERILAIPWLVAHLGVARLGPSLLEAIGAAGGYLDASVREVRP